MNGEFLWWRDGVIYQIYPRSFADANGDGLGDLDGIIGKLDYLSELGVDAVWLSPIYPSPDADFGYDVADHTAVDPRFGTLDDFDRLVAEAHARGIRIVLDLVLNHTSEAHPWFIESRSSTGNPKRDWYLWSRSVPNNWGSIFGGSGWERDSVTGEYYYHMFAKQQPDLNWRNPAVREAQLDVVRFWLARGVDGFRLDVFNAYFKDERLRSNPSPFGSRLFVVQRHLYDIDQAEMHPLLAELRSILDGYPETYAVGETFLGNPAKAASYCGPDALHAAFNFEFSSQRFSPRGFERAVTRWNEAAGNDVWPNYVLSNHDQRRAATRYCRGSDDGNAAVAIALLLTLRGTPFLYYGEEIGMRDIRLHRREILDPPGRYFWPFYRGRDGCRSPMQWTADSNAGFCRPDAVPWLPVNPDYPARNAQRQRDDPRSLWNLTASLIALRRREPCLRTGDIRFLPAPPSVLAYERTGSGRRMTVVLSFGGGSGVRIPSALRRGELVFSGADSRVSIFSE